MQPLTTNTKAILLLTAPLIVGRGTPGADLLTPGEYKALAQRLHEIGCQPEDLIGPDEARIIEECRNFIEPVRLKLLLARGLQLAQAVDRWQQRAIWVISRADPEYPKRLKAKLRSQAPAALYGCGDVGALDEGGLAVVGSRHVNEELSRYAMEVGLLAARADRPIVSGGAKGIDQAAMRGALEAGGKACGILTDSLEKQVMTREHRDTILNGQLVLVSPYDPNAGFNTGHAMQRNKYVYALADAALVVSSDVEKGGTWAGAIEQLKKLKLAKVYVRSTGSPQRGLDALRSEGAIHWPNPTAPEDLQTLLDAAPEQPAELQLSLKAQMDPTPALGPTGLICGTAKKIAPFNAAEATPDENAESDAKPEHSLDPADQLFAAVQPIIIEFAQQAIKDGELAAALHVPKLLAKTWLDRMVDDGVLQRQKKPAGYVIRSARLL
ncbi:DNA-processing protein DprA [Sandarakinorhabdus sp.]|uniref:DNA-processing protein DprA n=1 Tax=Sandarakinorhabdus sp. TaxID=1916663 RepID=UPI0035651853